MLVAFSMVLALWAAPAHAGLDARCQDLAAGGPPEGYDEIAQQDFLHNYYALATTFSPLHAPVPHEGGHGSIGIDGLFVPPLGCQRRLILGYTQTLDTNTFPVFPRLQASYSFPRLGIATLYAGVAYTPPIRIANTSASILSAELGIGAQLGPALQVGARFHATTNRTVAEINTPFIPGDPAFQDLFISTTFGVDAMVGLKMDKVVPYISVGFTDASTFFYVGDEGVTVNNFHPFAGLAASAGADALVTERLKVAVEAYGAAGGFTLPDPAVESLDGFGRYGTMLTVRARLAYQL